MFSVGKCYDPRLNQPQALGNSVDDWSKGRGSEDFLTRAVDDWRFVWVATQVSSKKVMT